MTRIALHRVPLVTKRTDPTDIAAVKRQQAEQAAAAKRDREAEVDEVRHVMGSKKGRAFVRRLIAKTGFYSGQTCYRPHYGDTAFALGATARATELHALLRNCCPDLVLLMEQEAGA